ncbi:MAG: glutathione S-transferase family protein [Pseudomonadota bacterium]
MTIKIHGLPYSSYTCTVLMTCIEKGAPFELDATGLSPISGARKRPHIDRHPFGRIPAIEDGDFQLFETSAICRYIDEKFDGPNLVPAGMHDRALMEQWISAINSYLDESFIRRFVLQYAFPRGENGQPDRAAIDAAIPGVRRSLRILNRYYGKAGYLVADSLTLADIFLAPILFYLGRTPEGPDLLRKAPSVERGLKVISERASFVETFRSSKADWS